MKELALGIDPGKDGGFCALSAEGVMTYFSSPTIGNEIDMHGIASIINDFNLAAANNGYKLTAFLEDVHAIHGSAARSTFEFGVSLGVIMGTLSTLGIPVVKVKPKQWQKKCWQGVRIQTKKVKGKTKTDTKNTSLVAAKRLFPAESFLATQRSTTPHDGIVDASLIAYYGLNFYKTDI